MRQVSLRDARKRKGFTQEQLADRSGVDQTTISRLENDPNANPTRITTERLAEALGIAPSRLRFSEPQPDVTVDPGLDRAGQHASEVQ